MKPIVDPREICIRPCIKEDMADVHKLDTSYMATTVSLKWLKEKREENADLFYVAHDSRGGAKPIGYIAGGVYYHPHTGKEEGYVSRLVVLPDYRRLGVGTMLLNALEYALAHYRSYTAVFVGVRKTNPNAQEFYDANGYLRVPDLDRPDGYADAQPDDRYMMVYSKPVYRAREYAFNSCVFMSDKLLKVVPRKRYGIR